MRNAETVLKVIQEPGRRTLESRMMRKYPVRFGGGPMEKYQRHCWPLAGGLPYLIAGEAHLRHVLAGYVAHDNEARPHQGHDQRCPTPIPPMPTQGAVRRRDGLGGLVHECYREAA